MLRIGITIIILMTLCAIFFLQWHQPHHTLSPSLASHKLQLEPHLSLHYIEGGNGNSLLFIPGWRQTAQQFIPILTPLQKNYHVIALDMRGHGLSDKPDTGYNIDQLAKDLKQFITAKQLDDITLVGHSMGVSVIYSYLAQFGNASIKQLILIDQPPLLLRASNMNDTHAQQFGAILNNKALEDILTNLSSPEADQFAKGMISSFFTKDVSKNLIDTTTTANLQMPHRHAATLLTDLAKQDWRHLLPTIHLPTLVIAGEVSLMPYQSLEWTANQLPNSQLVTFNKAAKGSHFMFLENPHKFQKVITDFMAQK